MRMPPAARASQHARPMFPDSNPCMAADGCPATVAPDSLATCIGLPSPPPVQVFQEQLLGAHPEALPLLLHLLPSGGSNTGSSGSGGGGSEDDVQQQQQAEEAAVKALYCLSAFLRLSAPARSAFYEVGGLPTLQALLAAPAAQGGSARLKRRGLTLLADLVQLDSAAQHGAAGLDRGAAVAAALQLLDVAALPDGERDTDMQVDGCLGLSGWVGGCRHPGCMLAAQVLGDEPAHGFRQLLGKATPCCCSSAAHRGLLAFGTTRQLCTLSNTVLQEKALLVLLALLHSEGAPGQAQPTGAASLIAEAGGEAIVQRLEDVWRGEAEAAAAAGEEEGEDPSFLQELVALCRRVRQRVAAAREQAGGTAHVAGSLGGGSAMRDPSEL